MDEYRKIYLISVLCMTFVVFSIYVRDKNVQKVPNRDIVAQATTTEFLKTDSTFYEPKSEEAEKNNIAKLKPSEPAVSARSYLVGNVLTGKIYIEKNSSGKLPVASMSKLVTAMAATEFISPTTTVTITEAMQVTTDSSRLTTGETFTITELLYPMLLNSSNVAAEALAGAMDRDKFIELMYSYAHEIGMPSTFFADPSGLSPQNSSSARDFFNLARYLYERRPDILSVTKIASTSVATSSDHFFHVFTNIHPFVNRDNFVGGKTGHTPEARDTMLTIVNVRNTPVALVVLSSVDRKADTTLLLKQLDKYLETNNL